MRNVRIASGLALLLGVALISRVPLRAQADAIRTHVGAVMDSFKDTPNQQGLLPTATAEAKTAIQHAAFAAKAGDNLDQMKMHVRHVVNAIDPTAEPKGPGLGYGVKKAAAGMVEQVHSISDATTVPAPVKTQAVYAVAWATNVVNWSDQALDIAKQILVATSAKAAAPLAGDLVDMTQQLMSGIPAVGRDAEQGGLEKAQQRMELLKKAL